jgi:fucose 4-O-acetylase-like acetyltransferase
MNTIEVTNQGGSERSTVYDWLRLVATIFVVVGHAAYLNIQTTYGGVAYELPSNVHAIYYSGVLTWLRNLVGWIYGFHMPLFFMLSGAVMGLKPIGTFDRVVRSKVKRLLVPYFLYGWCFMLPVKWIGNFYTRETLKNAMRGFLQGEDSGHLWFLTALFWCMIVFVLYFKILERCKVQSIYIVLFVGGVIQLFFPYLPFDILGMKKGVSYLFYFALGYVFEKERQRNPQWSMQKTVAAYVLLLGIEILQKRYGILNSFFFILAGSFLTYLFADLCNRLFPQVLEKRVWNLLIRNLFYIYLFHDPLEYLVLRLFFAKGWLTSATGCIAYVLCRTLFVFFISVGLGEIICQLKNRRGMIRIKIRKGLVVDGI